MKLQNTKLNKSGHNKFAGYTYFELGDFLPTVNQIFSELGLCGVVSYGTDLATLTITDAEDGSHIVITSPMAEANLKGCHPIQNLGAVETYTRRYLWVTALEIVEHDALDASEPVKSFRNTHGDAVGQGDTGFKQADNVQAILDKPAYDPVTPERLEVLKEKATEIVDFYSKGLFDDMFVVYDNISDMAEREALWLILKPNSEVRTSIKNIGEQKRKAA